MSNPKSDRPSDRNPPDRSTPQRKETNIRNEQNAEERNRNEERISPVSGGSANEQWSQRSQNLDITSGRKETTGSNTPGAEIRDRSRQQTPDWNQVQMDQTSQQRSYTGNSERTGQQYSDSVEGNSSQRADELNKPKRSQKKNQLDQSHGSELSEKERRQQARGMNSPGMKNDQEMHRSVEKRNLSEKQDRKTDRQDGEC